MNAHPAQASPTLEQIAALQAEQRRLWALPLEQVTEAIRQRQQTIRMELAQLWAQRRKERAGAKDTEGLLIPDAAVGPVWACPTAKLDWEKVRIIRQVYNEVPTTGTRHQLARQFGVSIYTIDDVIREKTWREQYA